MKKQSLINYISLLGLIIIIGCSKDSPNSVVQPPMGNVDGELIKLEVALGHSNTEFVELVNKVRGSVGRYGPASKVIWSRKNDYNLGLYVSANHVYGIGNWNSRQESYIDISNVNNGIFIGSKIPSINGNTSLDNLLIADFGLYHPDIPASATNTNILPVNDFYVGIMDNQRTIDNGFAVYPNNVQTSHALEMFDPDYRTTSNQTWANALDGTKVLVMGYPQDRTNYPNGAVSTGKVFTDNEALSAIEELKQAGDEEGNIPYDKNVEFIANAKSLSGMSGGGVFNSDGQLLGISVRATTLNNQYILRVVRITYIRDKLRAFFYDLPSTDRDKLRPFISGEL